MVLSTSSKSNDENLACNRLADCLGGGAAGGESKAFLSVVSCPLFSHRGCRPMENSKGAKQRRDRASYDTIALPKTGLPLE